jgi:hypothetical protein
MIESRCGIKCSNCEYKEQMNCAGCVAISNPFWGDCPVKGCCESKENGNCGECDQFPCGQLNQFAYDKEQGDDGARIMQCKIWCKGGE